MQRIAYWLVICLRGYRLEVTARVAGWFVGGHVRFIFQTTDDAYRDRIPTHAIIVTVSHSRSYPQYYRSHIAHS